VRCHSSTHTVNFYDSDGWLTEAEIKYNKYKIRIKKESNDISLNMHNNNNNFLAWNSPTSCKKNVTTEKS